MRPFLQTLGLLLALALLFRPDSSWAQQVNTLDYGTVATGDRKTGSDAVSGTTVTYSGYTSTVTGINTNTFAVGASTTLSNTGNFLVWQQNNVGIAPGTGTTSNNVSTVTLTFSRAVSNLTITLTDIDSDNNQNNFTDRITFDGYAAATGGTPYTLTTSNVKVGTNNTNAFVGSGYTGTAPAQRNNAVTGTASSVADRASDVTVSFSSAQPVTRLVLTYENIGPFKQTTTDRTQTTGIVNMTWYAQADLSTSFTSAPNPNAVTPGSTASYTVQFANNGPDNAASATDVVQLPIGATNVNTNNVGTYNANNNTITYSSALNSGASSSASFSYTVPAATGTYATTSTVSTTAADPVSANNTVSSSLIVSTATIAGTVYDDVNYGGGAGRPYAAANTSAINSGFSSGAIGRAGATVEFYDNNGNYVGKTTTGTNGAYSYTLPAAGTYTVRVVNSTVTSARTVASGAAVLPVQTYVLNDANRVGGENPAYTDAAANSGSQALAALSSGTVTPQSRYTAAFGNSGTTGVDFGFNFDTVVNTNDVATVSGTNAQGSLRQFLLNANALSNTNLDQAAASTGGTNPAAGVETSLFMVPGGTGVDGLRAGLTSQLTNGVAVIAPVAVLPTLTDTFTRVDGTTQTQNVGNTNDRLLGTGGKVGTQGTTLSQLNGPEVQLTGSTGIAIGLDVASSATNTTITGLAILDFGNSPDNDGAANIRGAANSLTITQNVLGTTATAFAQPATLTNSDNVRLTAGTSGIVVSNNLIGYSNSKGISIDNGVTNVRVTGNEVRGNGLGASNFDGLDIQGSVATVTGNLFTGTSGQGIDSYRSAGQNTITNNTVTDNGRGTANLNPSETPGIRIYGAGNTLTQNIIASNYGAGIMLEGTQTNGNPTAVSATVISQNSIYGNGTVTSRNNLAATGDIGIDLQSNGDAEPSGTSPYVTLNSSTTTGANGLVNYPVITSAYISGANLVVSGYSKAGAKIELFTAQPNPTSTNPANAPIVASNFGQGATYLTTVTEGATTGVVDNSGTTGQSYSGTINGFNQGSDTNANGFSFTIPLSSLPGGTLAAGTLLTSTATLTTTANNVTTSVTSEFSGNATAVQALTGYVYEDVNYGGGLGRSRTTLGSAAVGRPGAKVELYDANGNYVTTAITDANGMYSLSAPVGTGYTVRVVNNSVLSSRTGQVSGTNGNYSGDATTGYLNTLLPVQTYNGTTNRVGGENPAYADAPANTGTQTLASLSSGTVTPQSIAGNLTIGSGTTNVAPDFGFNFDTVVNLGDVATVSGNNAQGSLRQFIINSNALGGETTLAPVYTPASGATTALPTGLETSIFMIPNGSAVAGQRAGLTNAAGTANFTTPNNGNGTAATIVLAAALPDVTGPATAINGGTQTRSTGDSNAPVTTAGAESTGPEVLLNLNGQAALTFKGSDDQLVSMGAYNSVGSGQGIYIGTGAQRVIVQNNTINNNGANITFQGTNAATPSTATISGNIIRDSQRGLADGIELNGNNSNMTITGNQLLRNNGFGIDFIGGANASNTISNNVFAGNGTGLNGSTGQGSGIGLRSSGSNNNTIANNTFTGNNGAGIIAKSGTTGNVFSQNSFSGNGNANSANAGYGLGIDLMAGTTNDNGDGVTKNDSGDSDTGANGLINFPIIQSATLVGNTLTVTGLARPNARVELYLASDDPTHYGEGSTYLTTITQPASGTATAYSGPQNDGLDQGSDTGALPFTITYTASGAILTALQASTGLLTSTATLTTNDGTTAAGNFGTSEFSGNARIFQAPVPNDVVNVNVPDNQSTAVVLNPNLNGTAYGLTANVTTSTANTIAYYTIASLPASGTLYYNGTALTTANIATTQVSDPTKLTYLPVYGNTTTVSFTYTATDADGLTSTQHSSSATNGTISNGAATYTIPFSTSADVTASLTGGTTVNSGQPTGYYTATFTNEGPEAASNVTQTVALPSGATLTTAQQQALTSAYQNTTFATNGGVTTITFPQQSTLASGASNSYRFAFTAPTTTGSSPLTASTSTGTSQGTNAAPDQATLPITTNPVADVQAAIAATATAVAPGATARFTATFRNNGQAASGVQETVQLIPGLTASTLTVGGQTGTLSNGLLTFGDGTTYSQSSGVITYPTTTLAAGASTSSAIAFTMPTNGPVAATASVSTTTAETNLANNVGSASIAASPTFDLATTLTGAATAVAGSPYTLLVSTTNNGPQAVSGAVQTVTIPTGLTASGTGQNVFISNGGTYDSSTGVVTFPALGSLPSGQMVGNTISFTAPASGSFKPVATVKPNTTDAGDTAPANNTAYLNGAGANDAAATLNPAAATSTSANVYAILSTTSTIVASGTQVTYTAGVGNAGPASASNATTQLQLVPGLTTSTILVAGQAGTLNNGVITFPNGATYNSATGMLTYGTVTTLASGSSSTAQVQVTVPANVGNNGQLLATASVGSATSDNVPADNVKAIAVAVLPTTDVATTLVGPTSGVVAGQLVSYTATFTNNGPAAATATAEAVQLPAGLSSVSVTDASNNAVSPSSYTYNSASGLLTFTAIASDAVGSTQTYNLAFAAPAQTYTVSSAIGSETTETSTANNTASVTTTIAPTTDVAISIAGPATATAGSQATYAVTESNKGPNPATGVAGTVQLPAGLGTVGVSGGGSYNNSTGLVTLGTLGNLPAGASAVTYLSFTMPSSLTAGTSNTTTQLTALATVTSTSTDNVATNNAAAVVTDLAPTPASAVDLAAGINPSSGTVTAGNNQTLTFNFRNTSTTTAAAYVRPAGNLPTGLTAATLTVTAANGTAAQPGTLNANTGLLTFADGTTYDPATGLLTFAPTTSLAASGALAYGVTFPLPVPTSGNNFLVTSEVTTSSNDAATNSNGNRATSLLTVSPAFDLTTSITGPAAALPGQPVTYSVTSTNSGPSTATGVTETVQLPANQTTSTLLVAGQAGTLSNGVITYPNGATYTQSTGALAFATISSLASGSNGAITSSFTLTYPNVTTQTLTASIATTATGETNPNNNSNQVTTAKSPLSLAPTAENIVNSLQSVRGNTSPTNLLISPLVATDPDGSIATSNGYTIVSLPSSGTLYYNGTAITAANYQLTDPTKLSYQPAAGFVGNVFFTYTALDNSGVASNVALYTIPVAQDQSTTYATYNTGKGGSNPYVTGDVLATTQDPNTDTFNSAGLIYNATTGALQSGAATGVASASYTGTLPAGVMFATTATTIVVNGATVQIPAGMVYVSNASQLPRVTAATNYSITVTTTDLNGGVNSVPVTIKLGAYPLPVELAAFTAQAVQNRDGLLKWTTASEFNNDHFELERSLDGVRFTKIGQVAGQGSKASATDYAYTDAGIGQRVSGTVYYRLRQVDTDGTSNYSPVRTVSFAGASAAAVSLYPNPAATATGLDLSALPAAQAYSVTLLDATGRMVRQLTLAGGQVQALDLRELASGTYALLVTGSQADGSQLRQTLRLIKE